MTGTPTCQNKVVSHASRIRNGAWEVISDAQSENTIHNAKPSNASTSPGRQDGRSGRGIGVVGGIWQFSANGLPHENRLIHATGYRAAATARRVCGTRLGAPTPTPTRITGAMF